MEWRPDHPDCLQGHQTLNPSDWTARTKRQSNLSSHASPARRQVSYADSFKIFCQHAPRIRNLGALKLVIVHNHFRPGGVRRVIELATPYITASPQLRVSEVVLACGEQPDSMWLAQFRARVAPVPVTCITAAALQYLAEQKIQPRTVARRIDAFLANILAGADAANCVVWAHNQGLGRNLILSRELAGLAAAGRIRLILHHHDWWFDSRWQRWPEMRQAGFNTLRQVAEALLPAGPNVRHIAINRADATVLTRHYPNQTAWLPNPVEFQATPPDAAVHAARRWLHGQLGARAPVWLMPCRLLRRKNIAEAVLLTRWLRPDAWLVTTGGVSSKDELAYAARLKAAAQRHGWRLRLGVLAHTESSGPSIEALMAVSEAVRLTSLQEGFGLPYIEAAAAGRPLIARAIPNVVPDLEMFGFRFPQMYRELLVDPGLFDWRAELGRQKALFRAWRAQLPRAWRKFVGTPTLLATGRAPRPIPFSRLTLTAQLEVLAKPAGDSWRLCAALNPFLERWRNLAEQVKLHPTVWPERADAWLSGPAYARKFGRIIEVGGIKPAQRNAPSAAQAELARLKLASENLYPLLWHTRT